MVELGWTPNVSESSIPSSGGATSSSHQPPTKSLKALDVEAVYGPPSSPRELSHSSGHGEDSVHLASLVPHAPEIEEVEEGKHDADDFVPNKDRSATLESRGLDVHTSADGSSGADGNIFVISAGPEFFDFENKDEAQQEDKPKLDKTRGST